MGGDFSKQAWADGGRILGSMFGGIFNSIKYAFEGAKLGAPAGPIGAAVGIFGGLTAGLVKGTIETVNTINELEDGPSDAGGVAAGPHGKGFTPEALAKATYGSPARTISLIEAGILGGDDPQAQDFVKNLRAGNTLRGSWNAAGMNNVNREMSRGVDVQIGKFLQQKGGLPPRMVAIMGDPLLRSQFLSAQGSSTTRAMYNNVIYGASSAALARQITRGQFPAGTGQLPARGVEGSDNPPTGGAVPSSAFSQDAYARGLSSQIATGAPTAFVGQST